MPSSEARRAPGTSTACEFTADFLAVVPLVRRVRVGRARGPARAVGNDEADRVRPLLLVERAAEDRRVGEHGRTDDPLREVVLLRRLRGDLGRDQRVGADDDRRDARFLHARDDRRRDVGRVRRVEEVGRAAPRPRRRTRPSAPRRTRRCGPCTRRSRSRPGPSRTRGPRPAAPGRPRTRPACRRAACRPARRGGRRPARASARSATGTARCPGWPSRDSAAAAHADDLGGDDLLPPRGRLRRVRRRRRTAHVDHLLRVGLGGGGVGRSAAGLDGLGCRACARTSRRRRRTC